MCKQIIISFFKKQRFSYFTGIVFMLLTSYIQSLLPKVIGKTMDVLRMDSFDQGLVKTYIVAIIFITLSAFLTAFMWRNFVIVNSRKLECHLREMLYDHFLKLSPEYYNRKKTGDLISYAVNDISAVRMVFGPATAMSINGVALCLISIYSMSQAINWYVTLISLLPIPLIVFVMLKVGKRVKKRFKNVQENFSTISGNVQENIYGIRVIKSYVQEEDEMKNFEIFNERMAHANIEMVKASSLLSPAIEVLFSISFVISLIMGGNRVLNNQITLGDFIAFNGFLMMIISPIMGFGRIMTLYQKGLASLKRLNEIMEVKPQIVDGEKRVSKPVLGEIEINNLDFSYPHTQGKALEDISIKVPKGSTLGIVGKTGSGKSTLANLLLKLYKVEEGKIFIDNTDINDYSMGTLREGFGYVPQENFLFMASIKDNISFFKTTYSEEAIEMSARQSCIYESIASYKDGFDTILGERGVNLSGGQKQRISIARALVHQPPVLLLDDSLSAVDAITEAKILGNLKKARENKTTIIIAHRMSAVEHADEIIVLEGGRICERGTHLELLIKKGAYYEIYTEQTQNKN